MEWRYCSCRRTNFARASSIEITLCTAPLMPLQRTSRFWFFDEIDRLHKGKYAFVKVTVGRAKGGSAPVLTRFQRQTMCQCNTHQPSGRLNCRDKVTSNIKDGKSCSGTPGALEPRCCRYQAIYCSPRVSLSVQLDVPFHVSIFTESAVLRRDIIYSFGRYVASIVPLHSNYPRPRST
jgi:hypothetical protein